MYVKKGIGTRCSPGRQVHILFKKKSEKGVDECEFVWYNSQAVKRDSKKTKDGKHDEIAENNLI